MKKVLKMVCFTVVYIVLPVAVTLGILQLIKDIGWINSMRQTTPTSAFLFYDPFSIILLFLLVKFIRRENPFVFANVRKIPVNNVLLCAALGLVMALFTNSLLGVGAFKSGVTDIGGSIDWIIQGNVLLITLITLLNSTYKEFCFRGLAFNEMAGIIPVAAAVIIQAMFYALEVLCFQNPLSVVLYAFFGQMVFGIIFFLGGSMWSSWLSQICCSIGLVLLRRTGVGAVFTDSLSIVIFILSTVLILALLIVLGRTGRNKTGVKIPAAAIKPEG